MLTFHPLLLLALFSLAARKAEDDARAAEEAQVRAEIEARQRESEEKAKAAAREERERQRAADLEKIRLQQQREDEALARRKAGGSLPPASTEGAWKRPTPTGSPAPSSSPAFGGERKRLNLVPRSQQPKAPEAPAAASSPAPVSVAPPLAEFNSASSSPKPETTAINGDDGFTTVEKPTAGRYVPGQGKWSRGRGGSTMGSR